MRDYLLQNWQDYATFTSTITSKSRFLKAMGPISSSRVGAKGDKMPFQNID